MLAGHKVDTVEDALQIIANIEDTIKAVGYGTSNVLPDQTTSARTASNESKEEKALVNLEVKKMNTTIHVMDDEWVYPSIQNVQVAEDGSFDEDEIYRILQANGDIVDNEATNTSRCSICFYCKKNGHTWRGCFRLRNILMQNGMKSNGPFPADRKDFRKPRRNEKPTDSQKV